MEGNFDWNRFERLFSEKLLIDVLGRIGLAVVAIVGGIFLIRYVDKIIQSGMARFIDLRLGDLAEHEKDRAVIRKQTLTAIAHHGFIWVGYLIITLMTLDIVGLDIRPVLATAGVASLAVGFGAQNLVKDVISGFFIILEDQYGQGDVVNLDGETGVVENLNLRTTHLRNGEGTLIVKSNGSIGVVKNMTKDWSQIDFKIGVSYSSDLNKAIHILREEGRKLKSDFPQLITGEPDISGVDSLNESDISLRMFIRVRPGEQWGLRRQLNKRIKERFDEEGIDIPFPQRTLWMKQT